jgi:hypothetical protein
MWAWGFPLFFAGIGVIFAVLAFLADPGDERLTFWIMAGSFTGSALVIAAVYALVARSVARAQDRLGSWAQVVEVDGDGSTRRAAVPQPDVTALERAVRQALAAKGVSGDLQEEAVRKTLAAAAAGRGVVDLREYTDGGADAGDAGGDPVDRLERLAGLRDRGVLSEGEFAVAKAKLLSDL